MSLVNDVLRDLDERHRRVAGDRVAVRSDGGDADRGVPPPVRSRSSRYGYVTVSMVLAGIVLGIGVPRHLEPVPIQLRSRQEADTLGPPPPPAVSSARASVVELPAVHSATSGEGIARTVPAPSPRQARSEPAMRPRYVQPLTRKEAPPRASADGEAPRRSSAAAEPRPTPSASAAPLSPAAADVAVAARHRPSVEPAEPDRPTFIEVTPRGLSAEERLLRDFHAAADAYEGGALVDAERLLKDLIERDEGQHRARLLLARLYTDQGLDELAEAVLSQGLLHYPRHAPYAAFHARILARQGRDGAAVALLRGVLPAAHGNAEWHALLAGLHQRTGDSSAAARSYLAALRIDPTPGEWWVGLGMSAEQAGDAELAEEAYRKALQSPLAGEVERYVERRLRESRAGRTDDDGRPDETDSRSW